MTALYKDLAGRQLSGFVTEIEHPLPLVPLRSEYNDVGVVTDCCWVASGMGGGEGSGQPLAVSALSDH